MPNIIDTRQKNHQINTYTRIFIWQSDLRACLAELKCCKFSFIVWICNSASSFYETQHSSAAPENRARTRKTSQTQRRPMAPANVCTWLLINY